MSYDKLPPIAAALSLIIGWWFFAGNALTAEPAVDYPPGKLGEVVRLGEEIVLQTDQHPLSKPYVGNALRCTSCHLEGGKHPQAGSFLQTAAAYPAWSPRESRVITLEDRVLNCFMRSQNGVRPPNGSQVAVAVTTYITWLSTGAKIEMNAEKPLGPNHVPPIDLAAHQPANSERGKIVYLQRCSECHGEDGGGDDDNPPLWSDRSYNDGAGLSRVEKLAPWLKVAMPLDDATLSEQEAIDVAAFVNSHARPRFNLKDHLPPPERRGEYNAKK
ncbi:c-type cytochrome [Blastopirellula sp. J2-11]|uniref:c-type cytochrome n=1 Tax=Blastopirellula sp. J2-11 TaxID=2943192 RepID=UPI0021C82CCC|nr:c-type cytochrome [Blastopirellula sp. J2-11]UUO08316.1 c-type cytochrome [Blastopirellula sp. J2-11]